MEMIVVVFVILVVCVWQICNVMLIFGCLIVRFVWIVEGEVDFKMLMSDCKDVIGDLVCVGEVFQENVCVCVVLESEVVKECDCEWMCQNYVENLIVKFWDLMSEVIGDVDSKINQMIDIVFCVWIIFYDVFDVVSQVKNVFELFFNNVQMVVVVVGEMLVVIQEIMSQVDWVSNVIEDVIGIV